MIDAIAFAFMLAGLAVCAIGVIGAIRMPDFVNRMHATTIISTLGSILTMIGVALYGFAEGEGGNLAAIDWNYPKSALVIVVCAMVGGAITSHALARACFRRGIIPKNLKVNEMADAPAAPRTEDEP